MCIRDRVIADELKRNKTASLLFWILIGAIVSFLSGTRVVMVNMILLLVMVFIYKGTSMVNILKYFVFFILAIISFVLVMEVAKVDYNRIITDRILTENDGGLVEGSGGTRILAFELFPQFFMKSPIWGSGSEISLDLKNKLDGRSSQLHVGYLSYLYYFGLVGGLLYFLFMFYYSRKLFINAKIHKNWGPFFGWIGFPIANLTLNYMAPFEAGILLCVLFDRYYLICSKNKCQHTLRQVMLILKKTLNLLTKSSSSRTLNAKKKYNCVLCYKKCKHVNWAHVGSNDNSLCFKNSIWDLDNVKLNSWMDWIF
eukprot:TRINITY_DN13890_c0_g1_i1.p1 TRINITY_DN13890_c0_g1~~TRINITY_DN13890_c0_g1_i1.p1  ORF type:complete len:312 (-),score=14.66 TRINITY_DN13890_c0_g1_i1:220-1155(-)